MLFYKIALLGYTISMKIIGNSEFRKNMSSVLGDQLAEEGVIFVENKKYKNKNFLVISPEYLLKLNSEQIERLKPEVRDILGRLKNILSERYTKYANKRWEENG